jgi:hypothetical protein
MKTITCSIVILLFSITLYGQIKVMSVEELGKHGLKMEYLDSVYKNAISAIDSAQSVFKKNEQDTVQKSYYDLLQRLGTYFSKNGLKWGKTVKCWNRIYFGSNGNIDYFVYHFKSPVNENQESEYKRLLNEFINKNRFPVTAREKFSMCSGVIYTDQIPAK